MRMVDHGEGDDKIIAVAEDDISLSNIYNIDQLPPYFNSELQHFFEEYKALEQKTVLVEDFQDAEIARQSVSHAIENYKRVYA